MPNSSSPTDSHVTFTTYFELLKSLEKLKLHANRGINGLNLYELLNKGIFVIDF